jgi:DNA polymerase/3'-5' exonuclease PolX
MSSGDKIKLEKAMNVARRFLALIEPYTEKREIAGSVRRGCKEVGDIEIVCTENPFNSLDNLFTEGFQGMVVNGSRLKRFKYPKDKIQVELYIAQPHDYGRILAIRTGSSAFSHIKLAITWNRLGWCGTSDGLRRKSECVKKGSTWKLKPEYKKLGCAKPPPFNTEVDFFNFLGIPWVPPGERNWTSKHNELNY